MPRPSGGAGSTTASPGNRGPSPSASPLRRSPPTARTRSPMRVPPCAQWLARNGAVAPPLDRTLARSASPFDAQLRGGAWLVRSPHHSYTPGMAQLTTALVPRRSFSFKLKSYVALTKPRIIELLLVTTLPTMIVAADGIPRVSL